MESWRKCNQQTMWYIFYILFFGGVVSLLGSLFKLKGLVFEFSAKYISVSQLIPFFFNAFDSKGVKYFLLFSYIFIFQFYFLFNLFTTALVLYTNANSTHKTHLKTGFCV